MAYVICEPCIDVMDTACIDVCPVDCIHTTDGEKQLYIHPDECIDCGACEPACPVTAIFMVDEVPAQWDSYTELNAKFFETFVKPVKAGVAAGEGGEGAQAEEDKIGIEEFVQTIETPRSSIRALLRPVVMISQPVLGAFDAKFKNELEEIVNNPKIFSAAISTGINSLINLMLYPLLFFVIAIKVWNINLFSSGGNFAIFLGIGLAVVESIYRFKEELTTTMSDEQPRYGAALYGWLPSLLARILLSAARTAVSIEPDAPRSTLPGAVLTDGPIYQEDVRERYRRYGMVNRADEKADRYIIEIEFPRWVPDCAYKKKYNLPDRMPDYAYQIDIDEKTIDEKTIVVQAKLEDPRFAEVVGRTSSFPLGFRNIFHIEGQPENFQAMCRDKVLQIIVPKSGSIEDLVIERPVHYAKIKG